MNVLRSILRRPTLFFLGLIFDRKYLTGRYFSNSYIGFRWALRSIFQRNVLRLGKHYPWPVGLSCVISDPANIVFHPDDLNIFQVGGTYFQNFGATIVIGRGTYIAPNVGIITANHKAGDLDNHEQARNVIIGEQCWIGMNAVVLPGVELGPGTIVGAGSVVTKSFIEGHVLVAGVPARRIKTLIRQPRT